MSDANLSFNWPKVLKGCRYINLTEKHSVFLGHDGSKEMPEQELLARIMGDKHLERQFENEGTTRSLLLKITEAEIEMIKTFEENIFSAVESRLGEQFERQSLVSD